MSDFRDVKTRKPTYEEVLHSFFQMTLFVFTIILWFFKMQIQYIEWTLQLMGLITI